MIRLFLFSLLISFMPLSAFHGSLTGGGALDSTQHGAIGEIGADTVHFGNSVLVPGFFPALYSGLASFRDLLPPEATLLAPFSLNTQADFALSLSALDTVTGIKCVLFKYKAGGETAFRVDTLKKDNGVYGKNILGSFFNAKGFMFFAEVIDSADNITILPDTAADSAHAILVLPAGVSLRDGEGPFFPADCWRMLSVPVSLSDASPLAVLEPLLGKHDEKHWKMVRWNGQRYVSLSADAAQQLVPGSAFFLYVRGRELDFTTGAAKSVRIDRPYAIVLAPKAFTQIASPFAFPVAWKDYFRSDSARIASGISLPLSDTYENDAFLGLDTNPVLLPWQGYWAYNPADAPCTLRVNPTETAPAKRVVLPPEGGFLLSLSLEQGNRVTLGALPETRGNLFLPPAVDAGAPQLYFEGTPDSPARLTDFFAGDGAGNNRVSNGLVLNFGGNSRAVIHARTCGTLPEAMLLLDREYHTVTDLSAVSGIEIEKAGNARARSFTLVYGTRAFTANYAAALFRGIPDTVVFGGNRPNPFNPRTSILYGLPMAAAPYQVRVRLFDVSGRMVKELFKGLQGPGMQTLNWDGRSISGNNAPSGVYCYTIRINGKDKSWEKSLRLALVR